MRNRGGQARLVISLLAMVALAFVVAHTSAAAALLTDTAEAKNTLSLAHVEPEPDPDPDPDPEPEPEPEPDDPTDSGVPDDPTAPDDIYWVYNGGTLYIGASRAQVNPYRGWLSPSGSFRSTQTSNWWLLRLITTSVKFVGSVKPKSLNWMFYNCYYLSSIDFGPLDTSALVSARGIFYNCLNLREVDLSAWDTTAATDLSQMFVGCPSLERIITGDGWVNAASAATIPHTMYELDGTRRASGWAITEGAHTLTSTRPHVLEAASMLRAASPQLSDGGELAVEPSEVAQQEVAEQEPVVVEEEHPTHEETPSGHEGTLSGQEETLAGQAGTPTIDNESHALAEAPLS